MSAFPGNRVRPIGKLEEKKRVCGALAINSAWTYSDQERSADLLGKLLKIADLISQMGINDR